MSKGRGSKIGNAYQIQSQSYFLDYCVVFYHTVSRRLKEVLLKLPVSDYQLMLSKNLFAKHGSPDPRPSFSLNFMILKFFIVI